jgi:signal transduction histidine kinase
LLIALAGVMLALISSFLLSRRVTTPVNRLLEDTIRLGSGNLDDPIVPAGKDEIGALARGFEQMRCSLRTAREELLRAERLSAIGRVASAIVHDIRQPVNVIQGHVAMLRYDTDPTQREEDLAVIESQLERLNAMMSEILDFVRGAETTNPASGSIPDLLEEVTGAVRPILKEKRISLSVEPGYTGEWRLDHQRTRRVLENLVRNAAAAAGPGGRVAIRSDATENGLRLEVEDSGPGIPEPIREHIFEPFVTFGKKEGTGLGLAIVKSFTEKQGGTVRFETSPGGTRFLLEFPGDKAA